MNYFRQSIGIWIILVLISLPFPLDWLPRFGEFISDLLFPVVKLFDGQTSSQTYTSDSRIYYFQSALLIFPSLLLGYFAHRKKRALSEITIHTVICYLIAFFLFKYGVVKVFQHQFYSVEPNIAYTPIGHLSKDILFWTSMGTSYWYNLFMGIMEIIGGVLLLSRKTRMLGALLSIGIFTHVFAINVGFNITVKLFSLTLLTSSLYITWYYREILLNTFILHRLTRPNSGEHLVNGVVKRAIKGILVCAFAFECLYPFINGTSDNELLYSGSYQIQEDSQSNELFKSTLRIHFHSGGYLVTENHHQQFQDYPFIQLHNAIVLTKNNLRLNTTGDKNQLIFEWSEKGERYHLTLKKLQNDKLPVYNDNFNWTVESMLD